MLARSSDSFVVAVVKDDAQQCQDDLSRSKKRSSLKDITDSMLAKPRSDFLSEEDQQDLQKNFAPQNTQCSTHWALKVFSGWREAHERTKKKGGLTNLLLVISLRLERFFLGQDKSSSTLLCIILKAYQLLLQKKRSLA